MRFLFDLFFDGNHFSRQILIGIFEWKQGCSWYFRRPECVSDTWFKFSHHVSNHTRIFVNDVTPYLCSKSKLYKSILWKGAIPFLKYVTSFVDSPFSNKENVITKLLQVLLSVFFFCFAIVANFSSVLEKNFKQKSKIHLFYYISLKRNFFVPFFFFFVFFFWSRERIYKAKQRWNETRLYYGEEKRNLDWILIIWNDEIAHSFTTQGFSTFSVHGYLTMRIWDSIST